MLSCEVVPANEYLLSVMMPYFVQC